MGHTLPFKRFIFVLSLIFSLGMAFWLMWIEDHRIVPIVMYHHVDTQKHFTHTVSPDVFEKQLAYLLKNKFKVLSYDELVDGITAGKKHPRRSVVITFDDGYLDNFTQAFPLLEKYGFTATFFIPSNDIGQEGFMTWDQLRLMAQKGMTIGSHTRTQAYLPESSPKELQDEIFNSKNILEDKLNQRVDHFSYPIGGFNREIKDLVKQAGYKSGTSTNRGYDRYNYDVFELNRVTVDEDDNFGAIRWAKFSGYYNSFRKPRNPD